MGFCTVLIGGMFGVCFAMGTHCVHTYENAIKCELHGKDASRMSMRVLVRR